MATQPVPTFQPLTNPAPLIRRRVASQKALSAAKGRYAAPMAPSHRQEWRHDVIQMLPLVKRMAFKIREHLPAHVELDDLLGNGVLGLVDAVGKFDTAKRVKLESYARHRVRGGILDGLRGADPASRDMRRKSKRIQKVYHQMETKLGRPAADEEIAAALGLSLNDWHRTLNEIHGVGFDSGVRTLSAGPTSRRPSVEVSLVADHEADPFELCYRREQREIMIRALSHLPERERRILTLYYYQELTMKQIAERLNVDESRVSQLHSAALVRLKACVDSMLHRPLRASSRTANNLAMAAGNAS